MAETKFLVYCKEWNGHHAWHREGRQEFHLFLTMEALVGNMNKFVPGECGVGDGFPVGGDEVVLLDCDEDFYNQVKNKRVTKPHREIADMVRSARTAGRTTKMGS